jgi:hypothetical protein
MPADLVTWLRAQLDRDLELIDDGDKAAPYCDGGVHLTDDRWRAEVDAKRRILDAWETWNREKREAWADYLSWIDGKSTGEPPRYTIGEHAGPGLEIAVRLLALPMSDRPGYREEWRPVDPA